MYPSNTPNTIKPARTNNNPLFVDLRTGSGSLTNRMTKAIAISLFPNPVTTSALSYSDKDFNSFSNTGRKGSLSETVGILSITITKAVIESILSVLFYTRHPSGQYPSS